MGQLILQTFKLVEIQSFKLLLDKQKLMCKCPNQTLQNIQKSSFNLTTSYYIRRGKVEIININTPRSP